MGEDERLAGVADWQKRIVKNGPSAPPEMWIAPMLDYDDDLCNWDDAVAGPYSDGSAGEARYIRADLVEKLKSDQSK